MWSAELHLVPVPKKIPSCPQTRCRIRASRAASPPPPPCRSSRRAVFLYSVKTGISQRLDSVLECI